MVDFFRFCSGITSSTTLTSVTTETSVPLIFEQDQDGNNEHPWLNITSPEDCNEAHRKFKKHINDVIIVPYGHLQGEQEFFVIAEQYKKSGDYSEVIRYSDCFSLIEEGKEITDSFSTAFSLISQVVENDVEEEGLAAIEELMDYLNNLNLSDSVNIFDSRLNQTCGWRKDFSVTVREQAETYKSHITQGRNFLLQLEAPLKTFFARVYLGDWDDTFDVDIYLAGYITKQQLAKQFLSTENITLRESSLDHIEQVDDLMKQYLDQLFQSLDVLQEGYVSLSEQRPVTIINETSIQRLNVIQKALSVDWLAYFARRGSLTNVVYHIGYVIEWGPYTEIRNNITKPLLEEQQLLKTVEANLKEYQDSIKMDSDFYL